jgi:hypothetical protein
MKLSLKSVSVLSGLSAIVMAPLFCNASSAVAQPIALRSSYVGAGLSAGITNGGRSNDAANLGGNVQGRFAVPDAPVSVRGAVLFNGKNSVIIPSLSYDFPINQTTNLYAGAGYGFVQNDGKPSPLGNRNAAVLSAGIESEVFKGVMVYSDAKYGINAYRDNKVGAVSLQAGVGLRF